ncbi:MAG: hypothetical protein IPN33_20965 [Saprospiraceae bacterium]|nr:hypothetical protein [Saprospiraceae bacterium]
MCWVTWHANKLKDKTPISIYDEYNQAAHQFLPDLMERLAVIAALNTDIYKKLHSIGSNLVDLDAIIGEAIINRNIENIDNYEEFAKLSIEATKLEKNCQMSF